MESSSSPPSLNETDSLMTIDDKKRQSSQVGLPGQLLFRHDNSLTFCLVGITIYAGLAVAATVYVIKCPTQSFTIKALSSLDWPVNSLYSGLLLSGALTPLAIMIRQLGLDLALLHPFAISSRKATAIKDLDSFMNPGILSMCKLWKYSFFIGAVQGFLLLAGALIVPVGTLALTTDLYEESASGTAAVGMPTISKEKASLWSDMNYSENDSSASIFVHTAMSLFLGNLIRTIGVISHTSSHLGPTSRANLTFIEGVRYDSILTFNWTSGCEFTEDITYTTHPIHDDTLFNVTFPDQTSIQTNASHGSIMQVPELNDQDRAYKLWYALIGQTNSTINVPEQRHPGNITEATRDNAWISRVVCMPTFNWQVSSCVWWNGTMESCQPCLDTNTTALDTRALNTLVYSMTDIPSLAEDDGNNYTYYSYQPINLALKFNPTAVDFRIRRAPTLVDFDNMYGIIAQSIVDVVTSGYYGVAEVKTHGSAPREVYVVRFYILGTVTGIVVLVPLLTEALLIWSLLRHVPLRRATLLTIANAVRGPWWDSQLQGGCVMSIKELHKRHGKTKVMFGVDIDMPGHVGLAERTLPVQSDECYA